MKSQVWQYASAVLAWGKAETRFLGFVDLAELLSSRFSEKNLISKIKAEAQQDGPAGKGASLCKPNDLESISGTHIMVEGEN